MKEATVGDGYWKCWCGAEDDGTISAYDAAISLSNHIKDEHPEMD